jgi:PAS domain S-box-containing protein
MNYNDKTREELIFELNKLTEKYNSLKELSSNDHKEDHRQDNVLKESEDRFKTFSSIATEGVMIHTNGIIRDANLAFANLLGYSDPNELIGKNGLEIVSFTAESRPIVSDHFERRSEETFDVEIVNLKGEFIPVETRGLGIIYKGQESNLVYIRDITERIRSQKALRESEENFRILFDENPLPTVLSEIPSGKIAFVNKMMATSMRLEPKDIIGRVAEELGFLRTPGDQEKLTKMISTQGFVDNLEIGKNLPDGSEGTDLVFMRLLTINGKLYCLTVVHDITGRKKVEQLLQEKNKEIEVQNEEYQQLNEELSQTNKELRNARDRAEESDRLKSAFLTNMSHEIRTPMNGILGFSELLKEPNLSGKDKQDLISIIETSGARMLNIINDLIDISKIEAGQMEVLFSPTNVNEQIDYIYTFFKPEAEQKGIHFSVKTPQSEHESIIKTDKAKLNSILINLVKNAIKFTDKGYIEFGYNVEAPQLSALKFYVKDTGIGVPANRHHAIFDRFVQADISDTRAFQGAGLGLSISKAYVEMLGGKIWFESAEGRGSAFYFTIPLSTVSEETGHFEIETPKVIHDRQIKDLKILIVEDDKASEMLISMVVKKLSKEVLKVHTGQKAVEACRSNPDIDLVLIDIKMPGMDGYEATRQIRQFNKKVVIIAQTAFALIGDREKALEAGCNDYISKPTKKDLLLKKIYDQFKK